MANVYAVKSGNWSDTTVWNTGALPTPADDVFSNNFTVTVDVTTTVLSIKNTASSPIVAGGSFSLANGCNLTCTNTISNAGGGVGSSLVICSISIGQTATINANIQGGTTNDRYGLSYSGSGTLYINGNLAAGIGGGGGRAHGVVCGGTGNVYIAGGYTPTSNNQNVASSIIITGANTVYVVGGGTGSSYASSYGINLTSAANVYVTGTITGGTVSPTIINSGTGLISFTGDIYGTAASALFNSSTGQVTAVSNLYAVTGSAIASTSAGTIVHTGTATAANNYSAISSSNTSATVILSGPFLVSANGTHAVFCPNWKWQNTSPPATYYQIRSANLATIRPLYTADSVGGNPAVTNVRSGTVYGPNSELTGTCAVPAAASVAFGVPVDNTTGTAVLTAADVRSAVGLASANLDSQLDALPTAAEIAQAVWQYTTRTLSSVSAIVSGVWSATARTVTGGTVDGVIGLDPPSAGAIAAAIRTELATELGRIDVATSTRLSPSGTLSRVTLVDTATTLTNSPDIPTPGEIAAEVWTTPERTVTGGAVDTVVDVTIPTAAEIANAIRTELATELGRIDVATSTRLAPGGTLARVTLTDTTTVVTDTAAIAEAVRTELTPELARVANSATTQEVADIVDGAATTP